MHGIVHDGLKRFVLERAGEETWRRVLAEAGLRNRIYVVVEYYEDDELYRLIQAAEEVTGIPQRTLLEEFGEFITPSLMVLARTLIRDHWSVIDILLNTEETIHRHVRDKKGGKPPVLDFTRVDSHTARLHYDSPRRMCPLGMGIIRGICREYGRSVEVNEQERADGSSDVLVRVT